MTNLFKLALCKLGAGVKYVAVGVWDKLKSVVGSESAKEIGLHALKSAEALLKTEVGQFVKTTVENLETVQMSGPDKLGAATSAIGDYLKQREQAMPTIWIHYAIQTILLALRGGVSALTDKDSDGDGVPDSQDAHPLDATAH